MNIFQAIAQTVHHWITAGDYALLTLGVITATVLIIGGTLVTIVRDERA